jgi:hypothetical protein
MVQNDQRVQEAARNLFEGITPERMEELQELWANYAPHFNILDDLSRDGRFVIDAGLYREVRFNHRALRIFWVASFAAWEGYRAVANGLEAGAFDFTRFREVIDATLRVFREDDAEAVPLPNGVPEPGALPDRNRSPELRAAAELAHFAAGFALLHEVKHIIHQQLGTGAPEHATPADNHKEELSCDAFAIRFLLDRVDDYAATSRVSADLVRQKRKIGIYFALFAMALLSKDRWSASNSHPAMQTRLDEAIKVMKNDRADISDAIAHTAFAALHEVWPDAPMAFRP